MVELDLRLILDARRLRTKANGWYIRQLIIWYMNAIKDSRQGGAYKARHEEWLREFVRLQHDRESFARDSQVLKRYCSEINQRSISIYPELDGNFSESLAPLKKA
jgi:hypothetical protein